MSEKHYTIMDVIKKHGTPLYVYDSDIALEKGLQLKSAFSDFEILYMLKSNPNPVLAGFLSPNCHGAMVTSPQELDIALNAGFKPETITYGGPGKSLDEIKHAIEKGVGCISLESEREIIIMEEWSNAGNKVPDLTLRINSSHKPDNAGEYMAGGPSPYGIDEDNVLRVMEKYRVPLSGIHIHVASQILDIKSLVEHYRKTAELAKSMSNKLGFKLQFINFGGGIGVPYSNDDMPIDISELGKLSCEAMEQVFSNVSERPKLQLEIGRYLVAKCGTYYTEIADVKTSRGQNYVVVNRGINGFLRPAVPWAENHPCSVVSKENDISTDVYVITGRTGEDSDILHKGIALPDPQPGDTIAVHNAGAYGYTMSFLNFLSEPLPIEVVLSNGIEYKATQGQIKHL